MVAPLTSYVQRVNSSSTYGSTFLLVTPLESSFSGFHFIIANVIPSDFVSDQPVIVRAGSTIGRTDTSFQLSQQTFIHVESYKTIDGTVHRIDPTQFLQPNLNPMVTVSYECNDFVTYVGGAVIDRRAIAPTSVETEHSGIPLVELYPDHEFPQPYDLVLTSEESQTSADNVEFFQSSTFIMVGPIPVQFGK